MTEQQIFTLIPEWQNLAQANWVLSYFARAAFERREQAKLMSNKVEQKMLIESLPCNPKIRFQMECYPIIQIGKAPQESDTRSGAYTMAAIGTMMLEACHIGLYDIPEGQKARDITALLNACIGHTNQSPYGDQECVALDKKSVMTTFFVKCLNNPQSIWSQIWEDKSIYTHFKKTMCIKKLFNCTRPIDLSDKTAKQLSVLLKEGTITLTPELIDIGLQSANVILVSDQKQSLESIPLKQRWAAFAEKLGLGAPTQIMPNICFDGLFELRTVNNQVTTLGELAQAPIQLKKKIAHRILDTKGTDAIKTAVISLPQPHCIKKANLIENPFSQTNEWQRAACY